MKKLIILSLIVVAAGCVYTPPEQKVSPPVVIVQPTPVPAPELPQIAPVPVAPQSEQFIAGYRDGYAGSWLGPARWVVSNDYRNGHQAGVADRKAKLPSKFPIN